jgi:hypothetical protein
MRVGATRSQSSGRRRSSAGSRRRCSCRSDSLLINLEVIYRYSMQRGGYFCTRGIFARNQTSEALFLTIPLESGVGPHYRCCSSSNSASRTIPSITVTVKDDDDIAPRYRNRSVNVRCDAERVFDLVEERVVCVGEYPCGTMNATTPNAYSDGGCVVKGHHDNIT